MLLSLNRNVAALGANGPHAVRSVLGLVAVMLRAERGERAEGRAAPREALLERVRACIDEHLADPLLRDVPVAALASRWGFPNASHFGQVCKRETGRTPAEFRQDSLG
ncbi:helix-turn-helix domain-containing protein [Prauserella flavalba]|uniref:HTH araC/xylS-type domain-containing protein n=1 Tax=Prauserella flavalba TaxID=1477506 RepID=A0A318LTY6_9PSEU|nr:helix-turn-helix domain-containing protein [Prauserella flavalba]PXY35847.1 hypothetical protein BA062_10255 [Prauserella flavalba]